MARGFDGKNNVVGNGLNVTCPSCGDVFALGEALEGEITEELNNKIEQERLKILKETEEKVRKEERARFAEKINQKEAEISTLTEKIQEGNKKQMEFIKKERELDLREKELPLKIEEAIEQRRKEWEEKVSESFNKIHEAEVKKLQITIDQQKKEVEEMRRRLEQGSQEMQGEVQELMLEDFLESSFPRDIIDPVPKGAPGADIVQTVLNEHGELLGKIIWESKNTKTWSEKWLEKLMKDKEEAKGDFAVLVSHALPKDIQNFGVRKGILIADYNLVYPIAYLVRNSLVETYNLKRADIDRTEKEKVLYNFVLGKGFQDLMIGSASPIIEMMQNLQKEKASMQKIWSQREIQLNNSLKSLANLYGNISGIVRLPEIDTFSLEGAKQKALK